MPAKLIIRWEGDVPGLDRHLIDIGVFHEPLRRLQTALRWIASGIIRDAFGDGDGDGDDYGAKGGRLKKEARSLNVYLRQVHAGCAMPEFSIELTPAPGELLQLNLFDSLPERAALRFVEAVDSERQGQPAMSTVRSYLTSLPALARQSYTVWNARGEQICHTEFSTVNDRPAQPDAMPRLIRGVGQVAGLTLLDNQEVKLCVDGTIETFAATQELVDQAIRLRGADVRFVAVKKGTERGKLLRVDPPDHQHPLPREVSRANIDRWRETLDRLGEGPA